MSKRLRAKLREVKQTLLRLRHQPIRIQGTWLQAVVRGYFKYHSIRATWPPWNRFARRPCSPS